MTDRVHFADLTKINVPFGLLDDDTQALLKSHGGPWEWFDGRYWLTVQRFSAKDMDTNTYRAKPQPLTKPAVPWDMMADWVQYVARDADGKMWAYKELPIIHDGNTKWSSDELIEVLSAFKIDAGNCDWRDSLVKRPEVSE